MATAPDEVHEARVEQNRAALWRMLPRGLMWTRRPDGTFDRLLHGLAEEFANVEGRAGNLLLESDPRQALELISDWERVAGLPDVCSGLTDLASDPIEQRRDGVVAKLIATGGQSIAFLLETARRFGWYITILEHAPPGFIAGPSSGDPLLNGSRSRAGDPLENAAAGWAHHFTVRAAGSAAVPFTAGSLAGEPLRTWGDSTLECIVGRAKPGHSTVSFDYIWEEADDWSLWVRVEAWTDAPIRVVGEDPPLESHLPAYLIRTLVTSSNPTIIQDEVGVMEATGVWQWLQFFVKRPLPGDYEGTPAPDFETQIWFGPSPPSAIAPSLVIWSWSGTVLTIGGGAGAPNAYVEDMGNGWYRATVGHASGGGQAGQERWASLKLPSSGGHPDRSLWCAGVKFATTFP